MYLPDQPIPIILKEQLGVRLDKRSTFLEDYLMPLVIPLNDNIDSKLFTKNVWISKKDISASDLMTNIFK